jgi:membrane protein required for colicin V production
LCPICSQFFNHGAKIFQIDRFPFAYILLFIAITLAMLLLARVLSNIFDAMALGGVNKFLGGVFGGLKIALIISILLNVFNAVDNQFWNYKSGDKIQLNSLYPLNKIRRLSFGRRQKKRNTKESENDEKEDDTENEQEQ